MFRDLKFQGAIEVLQRRFSLLVRGDIAGEDDEVAVRGVGWPHGGNGQLKPGDATRRTG